MNLPKQTYRGVESLGRQDINAPMRQANIEAQGHQQNTQIVNALADTAVAFEQAHTKHQVTQAAFDFDSDRRANMEQWLGKDVYNKDELEKIGVTLSEDDPRINIPAYEVLPQVMDLVNQSALESRAGKIGNKKARSEFTARQTAALGEEGLKYELSARQQMTSFHNKQSEIQVKELQDKGQFGPAEARIRESALDENGKRVALHQNRLLQETFKYENDMTRLDLEGMKEDLAHLVVPDDEYRGYLPAKQRGAYADGLRAAIAKADATNTAQKKSEHDLLKRKVRAVADLSQKDTPPTAEQLVALQNEVVKTGDVILRNTLNEVIAHEQNVGPLRYGTPVTRERVIEQGEALRTAGKLSIAEQVALDQRKEMDVRQTKAFREDPNKAWVALGGQAPVAPGTKDANDKPIPMGKILGSWSTLAHEIHAAQGIPGDDVRLIPKEHEQAFIQLFKEGNFESRKGMIKELSLAYGSDMSQHKLLWKQLGQVKNGAAYGAAGEIYSRGDEATGDSMLRGVEALENKSVDISKVKLTEMLASSKIGEAYWHDPDTMAQHQGAVLALAVGMAGDAGDFENAANYVDDAAEAIFTKVKYEGNYVAAPAGVKARDVRNWFNDMTEEELATHGGVSDPEWFFKGLRRGDLIPKNIDNGKYVIVTRTGVPVPNFTGGKLVLDYENREEKRITFPSGRLSDALLGVTGSAL